MICIALGIVLVTAGVATFSLPAAGITLGGFLIWLGS